MFKVGISGDLLNSENKPCFGDAPLELLKVRKDIEFFWISLLQKFHLKWHHNLTLYFLIFQKLI